MANLYPIFKAEASRFLCMIMKAEYNDQKDQDLKWRKLFEKHDDNEMALFCLGLEQHTNLSVPQRQILLDGLAAEYTEHGSWLEFVEAVCEVEED